MSDETLNFRYRFVLADGRDSEFNIALDHMSLEQKNRPQGPYPEWVRLGFYQCPNCPLEESLHENCPVAMSLVETVDFFKDSISYEKMDVFIETPGREYLRHLPLQEGLSSMVGLLMATSGCPHLDKLRPLARFHLPFATEEETTYRVLSMYLMAQFFRRKRGNPPDWEMKGLVRIYDEIRVVNKHFTRRLSEIQVKDASLNAIIMLDCFAISVGFSINMDMVDQFEHLFHAYLP